MIPAFVAFPVSADVNAVAGVETCAAGDRAVVFGGHFSDSEPESEMHLQVSNKVQRNTLMEAWRVSPTCRTGVGDSVPLSRGRTGGWVFGGRRLVSHLWHVFVLVS